MVDTTPHSVALFSAARSDLMLRLIVDRFASRALCFAPVLSFAWWDLRPTRQRSIRAVVNSDSFRSSKSRNAERITVTFVVRLPNVLFIQGSYVSSRNARSVTSDVA